MEGQSTAGLRENKTGGKATEAPSGPACKHGQRPGMLQLEAQPMQPPFDTRRPGAVQSRPRSGPSPPRSPL